MKWTALAPIVGLAIVTGCSTSPKMFAFAADGGVDADAGVEVATDVLADTTSDEGQTKDATPHERDAEDGGGRTTSACGGFCANIIARGCSSDDPTSCVSQCESIVAAPPCGSAYGALVACGASRAASDFVCDNGNGALADGVCSTQAQIFADCLVFGP
jgi:hypothetical protein